jgi:hypothetical protein
MLGVYQLAVDTLPSAPSRSTRSQPNCVCRLVPSLGSFRAVRCSMPAMILAWAATPAIDDGLPSCGMALGW